MFSQACVKNSVHRCRVYPNMHWGRYPNTQRILGYTTPPPSACWDTHPPGQTPLVDNPSRRPLQRTVRILLESILVKYFIDFILIKLLFWMIKAETQP